MPVRIGCGRSLGGMRSSTTARVAAATLTAAMLFSLAGCASPQREQQEWASVIEKLDGVESVELSYHKGTIGYGDTHSAILTVSETLTVAQAEEIVRVSCTTDAWFTELNVATPVGYLVPGAVEFRKATRHRLPDESACFDTNELVRYAQTVAAMRALPGSGVRFNASGFDPTDDGSPDFTNYTYEGPGEYTVFASASTAPELLEAFWELQPRIDSAPLQFVGELRAPGADPAADLRRFWILSNPGDDLSAFKPAIAAAFEIPASTFSLEDGGITATVKTPPELESPEVIAFLAAAKDSGVHAEAVAARTE